MIERLRGCGIGLELLKENDRLATLSQRLADTAAMAEMASQLELYFNVRELKRQLMFKFPEVAFSQINCLR